MVEIEQRARQDRDAHARAREVQDAREAARAGTADERVEERLHEAQVDAEDDRFRDAEERRHDGRDVEGALLLVLRARRDGRRSAALRFAVLAALLIGFPALSYLAWGRVLAPKQAGIVAALWLLLPYGWAWLDPDGQFLHDRLAKTRLIMAPPRKAG